MVDTAEKRSSFEKYGFPLMVSMLSILCGILLQKFVLSESYHLLYSINESSPIEVHGIQYFPVAFNVANAGNTALEDVVFMAAFADTIVTVRTEPPLSRSGAPLPGANLPSSSSAIEMAFDLAKGETHAIMVVAQGCLQRDRFFLKSKHVMGELSPIKSETEIPSLLTMVIMVIVGVLAFVELVQVGLLRQSVRNTKLELQGVAAEKDKLLKRSIAGDERPQ